MHESVFQIGLRGSLSAAGPVSCGHTAGGSCKGPLDSPHRLCSNALGIAVGFVHDMSKHKPLQEECVCQNAHFTFRPLVDHDTARSCCLERRFSWRLCGDFPYNFSGRCLK